MALEYTKDGHASLKNRLCYFEKGSPANPENWDFIKRLPKKAYNQLSVDDSIRLMRAVFY